MDALTPEPEPSQPGDFRQALRAAHASLDKAAQFAQLAGDPAALHLGALRDMLYALAEMEASRKAVIAEHRMHIDRDFNALRQANDSLDKAMTHAVTAAKAEVEKAHADTARQIVGSIARAAEQKLATMARAVWWRTMIIGSVVSIAVLGLGFGLGYWRGTAVGYDHAASAIQASGPAEQAVLNEQGPAGLRQWHRLMQDNGIVQTMKLDCKGGNIARKHGRTACRMWLWTTPYVTPAAHG